MALFNLALFDLALFDLALFDLVSISDQGWQRAERAERRAGFHEPSERRPLRAHRSQETMTSARSASPAERVRAYLCSARSAREQGSHFAEENQLRE